MVYAFALVHIIESMESASSVPLDTNTIQILKIAFLFVRLIKCLLQIHANAELGTSELMAFAKHVLMALCMTV